MGQGFFHIDSHVTSSPSAHKITRARRVPQSPVVVQLRMSWRHACDMVQGQPFAEQALSRHRWIRALHASRAQLNERSLTRQVLMAGSYAFPAGQRFASSELEQSGRPASRLASSSSAGTGTLVTGVLWATTKVDSTESNTASRLMPRIQSNGVAGALRRSQKCGS